MQKVHTAQSENETVNQSQIQVIIKNRGKIGPRVWELD